MSLFVRTLPYGCKIEDDERQISARLDGLGRWCTFREGEVFYRRALNGHITIGASGVSLANSEYHRIHQKIISWLHLLEKENPIIQAARELTANDYFELAALYHKAYPEPVTILPPDRYQDVVLQPARGCPNRKCTFCAFYKDKPYRILSSRQLDQHVEAVEQLLGVGFNGRNGVFLGSANALALSQRRLMPVMELIRLKMPVIKRGVACFADPDFSARRSATDWQELAQAGLRHVVIGLETGWPELRASLGKSGCLAKSRGMVSMLKEAGIGVGITVLNGICCLSGAERHLQKTVTFIKQLKLTRNDVVYLSPLSSNGVITAGALAEQQRLKRLLKQQVAARVVPYQMQRFNYYS